MAVRTAATPPRKPPEAARRPPEAARPRGFLALALLVASLAALKLALVASGPELDTDAYGHAVIGRRFLIDPGNLHLHWVWLPLWHVVHAAFARVGSGLEALRLVDVALSSAGPLLLARTLAPITPPRSPLPCAAGAILALSPQCLWLSTSSQPEIVFQLLVLTACHAWERDRPFATGLLSATAVLLRYEAWLLPAAWFLLWALGPRSARRTAAWLLPSLVIVGWCALHHDFTGEWLAFLRVNHDYVRDAIAHAGYPWGREPSFWRGLGWYAITQPYRDYGVWALLALAGLPWFVRRAPRSHQAIAAIMLAFLTYGTVAHKHLGLARHYVVLAPFFATAMAAGSLTLFRLAAGRTPSGRRPLRLFGTLTRAITPRRPPPAPRAAHAALLALALVALTQTRPFVRFLFDAHRRAFLPEREAARALPSLAPEGTTIATDLPRVEVYSALPYRRFIAWGGELPPPWQGPTGWIIVTAPARAPAGLRELFRNQEVVVLAPAEAPTGPHLSRLAPPPSIVSVGLRRGCGLEERRPLEHPGRGAGPVEREVHERGGDAPCLDGCVAHDAALGRHRAQRSTERPEHELPSALERTRLAPLAEQDRGAHDDVGQPRLAERGLGLGFGLEVEAARPIGADRRDEPDHRPLHERGGACEEPAGVLEIDAPEGFV